MRYVSFALLCVVLALLGGCAQPKPSAPTIVTYEQSGGIAGLDTRLTVNLDTGEAALFNRGSQVKQWMITDQQRQELRSRLDKVNAMSGGPITASRPYPDQMITTISFSGKAIRMDDMSAVPPEVSGLREWLAQLATGVAPTPEPIVN